MTFLPVFSLCLKGVWVFPLVVECSSLFTSCRSNLSIVWPKYFVAYFSTHFLSQSPGELCSNLPRLVWLCQFLLTVLSVSVCFKAVMLGTCAKRLCLHFKVLLLPLRECPRSRIYFALIFFLSAVNKRTLSFGSYLSARCFTFPLLSPFLCSCVVNESLHFVAGVWNFIQLSSNWWA